jgi:hypothetical protein
MSMKSSLLAVAVLTVSSVAVLPAQAQRPEAPSGMSTSRAAISDAQLDKAAAAVVRVSSIAEDFEQRYGAAPPEDRDRIVDEADEALEQAVTESGLSVAEYNMIIETAQADPEVKGRLLQRLPVPPEDE